MKLLLLLAALAFAQQPISRDYPLELAQRRSSCGRLRTALDFRLCVGSHLQWAYDRCQDRDCGVPEEQRVTNYLNEFVAFDGEQTYFSGDGGWLRGRLDRGTVARAYLPPGSEGRRLSILISGNNQFLTERAGERVPTLMAQLYYELRERGEPVLWFRSGDSATAIGDRLSLSGRWSTDSRVLGVHTQLIAGDVIRRLGPSSVSIVGYSWGGSRIVDLSRDQRWLNGVPVERTISVDPMRARTLGVAETRRPAFAGSQHVQFYQERRPLFSSARTLARARGLVAGLRRAAIGVSGAPLDAPCAGDVCERVPGADHYDIQRRPEVRERILELLDGAPVPEPEPSLIAGR